MDTIGRRDEKQWVFLSLIGVVVLAAALRFFDLGTESYWIDEVTMVHVTQQTPGDILFTEFGQRGRPPAYVLLGHFWTQVFGTTEAAARSLSAVLGIASVAALYFVGQELFDKRIGLIAALLMAVSVFQIYYSQEYRYYSLLTLAVLLSYYFFIRFLKGNVQTHDLIFYVMFSVIALYTHTHGVFAIAAQGVYFLLQWKRYKSVRLRWVVSQVLIVLGASLAIISVLSSVFGTSSGDAADPGDWIAVPSLTTPLKSLFNFLVYDRGYAGWRGVILAAVILVVGTLLFVWRSGLTRWFASVKSLPTDIRLTVPEAWNKLLLLLCWLVIPIIVPFILSRVMNDIYLDRYLTPAAPALYLLLAFAVVAARCVIPPMVSTAGLVALMVIALLVYYPKPIKEQWREVAAYIGTNRQPGDTVATVDAAIPGIADAVYDNYVWYSNTDMPRCTLDLYLDNPAFLDRMTRCGAGRAWVVIRSDNPDRIRDFTTYLASTDNPAVKLADERKFVSIGLYRFDPVSP